jgi:hypothetical protein
MQAETVVLGTFWQDAQVYAESPAGMATLFTGAAVLLLLATSLKRQPRRRK